jgi:hypothetical protein
MTAQRRRLIADGLVAGTIGYALVAVFFVIVNLAGGRSPLYTVALVGEAVFGSAGPAVAGGTVGPVVAFNGIHLVAYLTFGLFAAWLAQATDLHPQFWTLALLLFAGGAVVSYAGALTVLALIGSPLSTASVVAAGMVGTVGVGAYLAVSHRTIIPSIRDSGETPLGRVE